MDNLPTNIYFEDEITLNELAAWMDGGTITLMLSDKNRTNFEVVFCQTMMLEIHSYTGTWIPGSFLLNDVAIPIRSAIEKIVLSALKAMRCSSKISSLDKEMVRTCIAFVESEEYLEIAAKMGRL